MMKSLFSGVSGLKNHNVRMDVIGNNIANVNTTGYKSNNVTFRDVFYQTRTFASQGDSVSGGMNPRQVGYGLAMGSVGKVMTQSGFTFSDSVYDCAISGEGFFQVMDAAGNRFFTRNGVFNIDNAGNLVDSNGNMVLGVSGNPTGIGPSSNKISIYIPDVQDQSASIEKDIEFAGDDYTIFFEAAAAGPNGNISLNIVHGTTPFSTMNGNVLTVTLDLTQNFDYWNNGNVTVTLNPNGFSDAVNAAILAGGVNPGAGVLPLTIDFPNGKPVWTAAQIAALPLDYVDPNLGVFPTVGALNTAAQAASNTITFNANQAISFVAPEGLEGNNVEVVMKTVDNTSSPRVNVQWNQNVMTITLNENGVDTSGLTPIPTGAIGIAEINAVILAKAGTNPNRQLTAVNAGSAALAITTSGTNMVGDNPRRVGLFGGTDNFYRTAAFQMSTAILENGRYAGPQSVRDLELVFIDSSGVIFGEHPVHKRLILGRIDLAVFQNSGGLQQVGTSYYIESLSSGPPEVKIAESQGAGSIVSGALEMANVDLSEEFSNMIITQRGFQANSRIITVSDTMLEELINLKR